MTSYSSNPISGRARCLVSDDFLRDGVAIVLDIGNHNIVHWKASIHWTNPAFDTGIEPDPDAVLHLDKDSARALYEALANHFGGAALDTTTLRRDYDAERKRVDRFIGALLSNIEEAQK